MRAIHPESQEDAMEWHPIFEFRMFEQKRKDEEKNNSEEVLHGWNALCVISGFTKNVFICRHSLYFNVEMLLIYICSIV